MNAHRRVAQACLLLVSGCQSLSTIDVTVTPAVLDRGYARRAWFVEVERRWFDADGKRYDVGVYYRFVCDDDPFAFVIETLCTPRTELRGSIYRLPDRQACDHPPVQWLGTPGTHAFDLAPIRVFGQARGECDLGSVAVGWNPTPAPPPPGAAWAFWRDG